MDTLLVILISVLVVSLISFVGVVTLMLRKKQMENALIFLVSFSAGSCFGGAFIHLFPEAIEEGGAGVVGFALVGILVFFVMEKFLFWQHCHKPGCHEHTFAYMNLAGDGVHNFIDGVVIAASYLANTQLGVASTMAIVLHEIPQEIGDFAVLIRGGFTTNKALLVNFLTALTAVLGALVTFFVLPSLEGKLAPVLSFAAGGFIYIAGTDLVPELHKEVGTKRSIGVLISLILGVILIWALRFVE
jgi:zinc and cadmium transporter